MSLGRSPWSLGCLLGGHSTQRTEKHPCGITHPDAGVPPYPKRCQGSKGRARFPFAAARQLPKSYKEMPEPAATVSAEHYSPGRRMAGGDRPWTRNTWPEPGVTQLWVRGRAGAEGGDDGTGAARVPRAISWGTLKPRQGAEEGAGVAMGVTPFWVMHGAAKCCAGHPVK